MLGAGAGPGSSCCRLCLSTRRPCGPGSRRGSRGRPPTPVSSSRSPAGARAVWPGWWDQRGRPADSGSTAQVPTCEVTGCDAAYFYP